MSYKWEEWQKCKMFARLKCELNKAQLCLPSATDAACKKCYEDYKRGN